MLRPCRPRQRRTSITTKFKCGTWTKIRTDCELVSSVILRCIMLTDNSKFRLQFHQRIWFPSGFVTGYVWGNLGCDVPVSQMRQTPTPEELTLQAARAARAARAAGAYPMKIHGSMICLLAYQTPSTNSTYTYACTHLYTCKSCEEKKSRKSTRVWDVKVVRHGKRGIRLSRFIMCAWSNQRPGIDTAIRNFLDSQFILLKALMERWPSINLSNFQQWFDR